MTAPRYKQRNRQRAERAKRATDAYLDAWIKDMDEQAPFDQFKLNDMLADMLHLCDRKRLDLDFDRALASARQHHHAETVLKEL